MATSSSSSFSSNEEDPPKPISSDEDEPLKKNSEQRNDDDKNTTNTTTTSALTSTGNGTSRLFAPYRSLGIVSSGASFAVLPHQSSLDTMVVLPIGERFQMLRCDHLQHVLVSQTVPGLQHEIRHIHSDASLRCTLVTHGRRRGGRRHSQPTHVSLYHRAQPTHTVQLCHRKQSIVNLLSLGHQKIDMTGEKEGRTENVMIAAAILRTDTDDDDDDDENGQTIPVVGSDNDDSDSDESSLDGDNDSSPLLSPCQVVVLVAGRDRLRVQKRFSLPLVRPNVPLHPATYLNKIVIGGNGLLLVNVRSQKVVHTFRCVDKRVLTTALEQSPAVDTIAVGTETGDVHLINLRHDQKLFTLRHSSPITSLSFRTDASALRYGIAPLAVGRRDGTVSVWDLSPPDDTNAHDDNERDLEKTLLCEMPRLHPGGVSRIHFLLHEPLLLSTGTTSNSVLMHIFDNPDHSGRLLRSRKGHTAPPQYVRYLRPAINGLVAQTRDGTDASCCQILSTGGTDRTVRIFSSARAVLDKEYSQGAGLEKKSKRFDIDRTELLLPPVTAMAVCEARERDWGDLVTVHRNHAFAYVWSTQRGAQSGPVLRQPQWNVSTMKRPPPREAHATSLCISTCGNYALVGTRGGQIYKYNIQSGIARGSYPPPEGNKSKSKRDNNPGSVSRTMRALEKRMKVSNRKANMDKEEVDAVTRHRIESRRQAKLTDASHTGAVTGLAVDAVNRTLVSVGMDTKLVLWHFTTHAPHKKSPFLLPGAATKLCHVKDSDLAAIALQNPNCVVLFDCSALRIVRRFGFGRTQHDGPITDLGFSPDSRTLYTSSVDGSIRVWDVPNSTCIDWLRFRTPPTSLTVSPTGEFLATTHVNQLGISMWSDKSYVGHIPVYGQPPSQPALMDDPLPRAHALTPDEQTALAANTAMETAGQQGLHSQQAEAESKPEDASAVAAKPKEAGLITLSGLPPAHWKNLFHLELVKERNKPKEPPKKPPTAPFFLQWRSGEKTNEKATTEESTTKEGLDTKAATNGGEEEEEWAAAWDDDDAENENDSNKMIEDAPSEAPAEAATTTTTSTTKRKVDETVSWEQQQQGQQQQQQQQLEVHGSSSSKRPRLTHYRSHMASLLQSKDFGRVTDYVSSLGPSAIDVELSSLCHGTHDLEEGLPLIHSCAQWLVVACRSHERFEAVNAYLHRFLFLHSGVIAEIEKAQKDNGDEQQQQQQQQQQERLERQQRQELLETLRQLRQAQSAASNALRDKMQYTMCLLRHFTRMV